MDPLLGPGSYNDGITWSRPPLPGSRAIDSEERRGSPDQNGPDPSHGPRQPDLAPARIQAELRFLGYKVAELTVAKYMRRPSPRPSSTSRTFLEEHIHDIVAIDFFVVPTLTFRVLFGFLIVRHHRRELVHVNVTDHPTAAWAAQQLVESFDSTQVPAP